MMTLRHVGRSLLRTEDARLLRGLGRYTADLAPGDHCRMFVVRSPFAAARIGHIDTTAAARMPGVRLLLTGTDPQIMAMGGFTSRVTRRTADGRPNFVPPYRVISTDRARFAGDVVAAVFADSIEQAKDAAEALHIGWQPLPAVTQAWRAIAPRSERGALRSTSAPPPCAVIGSPDPMLIVSLPGG